jgi:DNA processing protein
VEPRLGHLPPLLDKLSAQNIHVWCDVEEAYPRLLRSMHDRPPVICVAGRITEEDEQAVAIVGTREPTTEGEEQAQRLAAACAEERLTVVSGLARGCDRAAHRGALAGRGRTIAVLGAGIRAENLKPHMDLIWRITESGAVVSELAPHAEPTPARLLARNRMQVGLSQAVIVVQAGPSGGAMRTAERATKSGRTVYAAVWPPGLAQAAGNELLIRGGARPLRDVEDVPELAREVREALARRRAEHNAGDGPPRLFEEEGPEVR